jgi:hypothetical protein
MPIRNSGPIRPPPTLCATFHTETTPPRSFCDHQCTMVRPLGGQPMPWAQPLMNSRMNIMVTLDVAHGAKPKMNITPAETSRPNGRK